MTNAIRRYRILPALLLLAVAGCGNYETRINGDGEYRYTPRAEVVTVGGGGKLPLAAKAGKDPQTVNHDPLIENGDPLAGNTHNLAGTTSSLAGAGDPMISSSNKTEGWYWIVGSISSGAVSISVNGVPIGRYTGHIDQEVTKYCHQGANTLTFTHFPLYGKGSICPVHLEILNGHAAKGSGPLLVYDTSLAASASIAPPASASLDPNAPGASALTGSPQGISAPAAPGASNVPAPPDPMAAAAAGPTTENRTFIAG